MQQGDTTTPVWAARFDQALVDALQGRDTAALVRLWPDTADGKLSHPTPDHWLPMLYAYGASDAHDEVRFPIEGFDLGSLSMRSVLFA
jgi:4,5-DOPA dioxygenase extradiol